MIKRNFMMAALILCMVTNASVPIYASGGPGVVIQETIELCPEKKPGAVIRRTDHDGTVCKCK